MPMRVCTQGPCEGRFGCRLSHLLPAAGCSRARLLVEVIELLRPLVLVQPHAARAVAQLIGMQPELQAVATSLLEYAPRLRFGESDAFAENIGGIGQPGSGDGGQHVLANVAHVVVLPPGELGRQRMRAEDLPFDVLHLDTHWFRRDWFCDLEFDPERFPDPAQLFVVRTEDRQASLEELDGGVLVELLKDPSAAECNSGWQYADGGASILAADACDASPLDAANSGRPARLAARGRLVGDECVRIEHLRCAIAFQINQRRPAPATGAFVLSIRSSWSRWYVRRSTTGSSSPPTAWATRRAPTGSPLFPEARSSPRNLTRRVESPRSPAR